MERIQSPDRFQRKSPPGSIQDLAPELQQRPSRRGGFEKCSPLTRFELGELTRRL
ncbi:MAG TPA: hypothetical protein VIA62_08240 [Thermoanaerobaculia bacterium]|nr:hypothetical protein [Thermoanaerobaculia bacterium]